MTIDSRKPRTAHGFTIVELLVVIVIIGILAAIGLVSYGGIQARARDTSVQSDIETMDASQTNYGTWHNVAGKAYYSGTGYDSNLAFTPSSGNVIDVVVNLTDYCIRGYNQNGTKNSIWNAYTKESAPGVCDNQLSPSVAAGGSSCPTGFIRVPGSSTYGTNDFCVMKYEAKNVGGVATSQAASTPWVSISQTDSITASDAACPGCRLISEARWLTIAQNVLKVSSNWSSGTVGSGYIYSGHNDGAPNNALAADTTDANGYYGETNQGGNQRRTLTLSDGEVMWDLAGNVWEWTSGTVQSPVVQPGVSGGGYAYREWPAISNPGTVTPNPSPAATGIPGASTWNSSNGIGQIYSSSNDTGVMGFVRGGKWFNGGEDGVLNVHMSQTPSFTDIILGFRVSR